MYLLYCDETNLEERNSDFLIYGGLIIPDGQAGDYSRAIDDIRHKFGVDRNYRLKFNPGPEGMDHSSFLNLKESVIQCSIDFGAQLICYLILHDIARGADEARRNGINTVCYHFDCILNRKKDSGLVLIDRFNDAGNQIDSHLRDKFTIGLQGMPYSKEMRLHNIVGFHYSAIGQSHFPSVVDVVLGSIRFAINAYTRSDERNLKSAKKIISLVSPLIWRDEKQGKIPELGICFSPKTINVPRYRSQYEGLQGFLAENGMETEQVITGERRY